MRVDTGDAKETSRIRARVIEAPTRLDAARRPAAGPISVLPASRAPEVAPIVRELGGEVAPLGDTTRGLVVLGYDQIPHIREALDAHADISWVQVPSAGIDAYLPALQPHSHRLLVTSAKGVAAEPVAEHALALALGVLREFPRRTRARTWGDVAGRTLFGANVVIVGAGGIALSLVNLLQPFRAHVTVVRRRPLEVAGVARTVTVDHLETVLPHADAVILAAASTSENRGLIGAREFAFMKPSAILVNIARGSLVDTAALVDALDSGTLAGAGLDVADPEPLPAKHALFSHDRVLLTPHTADTPELVEELMLERVRENVRGFLHTGIFVGIADLEAGY